MSASSSNILANIGFFSLFMFHPRESAAYFFLFSTGSFNPPYVSSSVYMNDIIPSRIFSQSHTGLHNSGWKLEKEKQIGVFVLKRPFGVNILIMGGLCGYSTGK